MTRSMPVRLTGERVAKSTICFSRVNRRSCQNAGERDSHSCAPALKALCLLRCRTDEGWKAIFCAFDVMDAVFHIYHELRTLGYHGARIDEIYVDEVQDFTQCELRLFLEISSNKSLSPRGSNSDQAKQAALHWVRIRLSLVALSSRAARRAVLDRRHVPNHRPWRRLQIRRAYHHVHHVSMPSCLDPAALSAPATRPTTRWLRCCMAGCFTSSRRIAFPKRLA